MKKESHICTSSLKNLRDKCGGTCYLAREFIRWERSWCSLGTEWLFYRWKSVAMGVWWRWLKWRAFGSVELMKCEL